MDQFIKTSELVVSHNGDTLKTIVGSCVALCLWDKEIKLGGMAHIMMPRQNGNNNTQPGKYADTAVEALLNKMILKGCTQKNLTAAVIGGASLVKKCASSNHHPIGYSICQVVKDQLKQFSIPLIKNEIGGNKGKRIYFDCKTGKVSTFALGIENDTY